HAQGTKRTRTRSVNLKFLPEDLFVSRSLAVSLLAGSFLWACARDWRRRERGTGGGRWKVLQMMRRQRKESDTRVHWRS
ncbi:MAG: hypothetical protein ACPIOQ_50715, partial [Promethearchaeia archaeon]